jgi:hypothetical protein
MPVSAEPLAAGEVARYAMLRYAWRPEPGGLRFSVKPGSPYDVIFWLGRSSGIALGEVGVHRIVHGRRRGLRGARTAFAAPGLGLVARLLDGIERGVMADRRLARTRIEAVGLLLKRLDLLLEAGDIPRRPTACGHGGARGDREQQQNGATT